MCAYIEHHISVKRATLIIKIPKTYAVKSQQNYLPIIVYNKEWSKNVLKHKPDPSDIEDIIMNYDVHGYVKVIPSEFLAAKINAPVMETFEKIKNITDSASPVSALVDIVTPGISIFSNGPNLESNAKCRVLVDKTQPMKCAVDGKNIVFRLD